MNGMEKERKFLKRLTNAELRFILGSAVFMSREKRVRYEAELEAREKGISPVDEPRGFVKEA